MPNSLENGLAMQYLAGTGTDTGNIPDFSGVDLAGMTPANIAQALQLKFMMEEIGRKKLSDLATAGYYGAATKKMEAETAAITPSIDVPRIGKLTTSQWVNWYKAASKDERTRASKEYDKYVKQETKLGTEKKDIMTFENWMFGLAKATGGIPEFAKKKKLGIDIEQRDRFRRPKFRTDIEKTIRDKKRVDYEFADDPEKAFDSLVKKEMNKQVMSRFPKAIYGRDKTTGVVGWFDKKGELIATWR